MLELEHIDTRLGLILNTYIFQNISPIQLTDYVPGVFLIKDFLNGLCSKRSKMSNRFFFLFYLWPWTRLDVRQPKLLAMVLNSTGVVGKSFKVSSLISLLHLVWWHCWHSSRNSLSEKGRRRKPSKRAEVKLRKSAISQNLPSCYSTLTSTSCCRLVFNKAQILIRGRQR